MRKLLSIIACLVMSTAMLMAQNKTVVGRVISSEDGEPIIGASVTVPGTNVGTVTDVDGNFSLKVSDDVKEVKVSFVGMETQTVKVTGKSLKVILSANDEVLDEVMVVAFGTTTKEAFTGSAAVLKAEDLSAKVTTNVAEALVGSVAGLQMRGANGAPGSNAGEINIRGIASMYSSTKPLVIVDGSPYPAGLNNIPQEDIESISVLKDAASAALYGARGAAGVIIVTTKRGNGSNARINVDMKWGANTRAIQNYETIDDPAKYYETTYAQYYNYSFLNQGNDAVTANAWANNTMLQHLGYNMYTVPTGENLIGVNGKLNPKATRGRAAVLNGETYWYDADNWDDAAYSTALRQEYNVSVTSGSDQGSFYASLGHLDEDGIIDFSDYKRTTARLKADYQIKKWLKVGANVGFVSSKTHSNPNLNTTLGSTNLMYYTSMIAPIYPIYVRVLDANGNPVVRTDENGNQQYDYGVAGANYPDNRAFLQTGNPLGANAYNVVMSRNNQLSGTFFADIDLTSWLKVNLSSNVNWGHTNYSDYENALYGPKVSVNGQIDKSQTDNLRTNNTQTLTYYKTFADRHNVNVLLGHEYYYETTTYLSAYGQGLFSPDIKELNGAASKVSSESYTKRYNVEGYFASANYNLDEKYYLNGSYRRDATSRFAKDNRWGNFWSVGASWLANKEDWFNVDCIDQLKGKVSIGQQGNDGLPNNWYFTDLYNIEASSASTMAPSFRSKGNPDITWETTTSFNAGVEFSLFKGRLSGNVDVYHKKTEDLLFWLSIPESSGTRGYYGNLGDIKNVGFEVVLNGVVYRNKDIEVSLNGNISHNKTEILSLPKTKTASYGGFAETGNNIQRWYEEGGSLYTPFLYSYAGVNEQGQALYYYDEDLSPAGGKVSTNNTAKAASKRSGTTTESGLASRYAFEPTLPKLYGGFGLSAKVYGFDVSATFDYQMGGKVYDYHYQQLMGNNKDAGDAGHAIHKDVLKSWSTNNTSSTLPRWQYGDKYTTLTSDRFLTNASYLNFQSFSVGYTLPRRLTSAVNIQTLRVYCSGENLCFWSARQGLDPRYSYEGNEYVSQYSPTRTVLGGIQVTF